MYREKNKSFLQKIAPLVVVFFTGLVISWLCIQCYDNAELVWQFVDKIKGVL